MSKLQDELLLFFKKRRVKRGARRRAECGASCRMRSVQMRAGPWCGGVISPSWGTSPSADDDGHGGANDPGQEVVGQRPQPV